MLVVMSKPRCGNCDNLKRLLDSREVSYITVDLTQEKAYLDKLIADGHRTVPQVYRMEAGKLNHIGDYTYMAKNIGEFAYD